MTQCLLESKWPFNRQQQQQQQNGEQKKLLTKSQQLAHPYGKKVLSFRIVKKSKNAISLTILNEHCSIIGL